MPRADKHEPRGLPARSRPTPVDPQHSVVSDHDPHAAHGAPPAASRPGLPRQGRGNAPPTIAWLQTMQQTYGNRAVQRLLKQEGVLARATVGALPADNALVTADGPVNAPVRAGELVGLKRGDGLDAGTKDRRPRVVLLQEQLNEKMVANLVVDGLFGPKTGEVLREFQASVDLPPQEEVDQPTAAALVAPTLPLPPAVSPGVPGATNANMQTAADALTLSAGTMTGAAGVLGQAGRDLLLGGHGHDGAAGLQMTNASQQLSAAALKLAQAGALIQTDPDGTQIAAAGDVLLAASGDLALAQLLLANAGQALLVSQDPFDADELADGSAGRVLLAAGTSLGRAGGFLAGAGTNLKAVTAPGADVAPGGAGVGGDPFVGLRRGDGLLFNRRERRSRVTLLQEKLNEKTGTALVLDGKFGPKTGAALEGFQQSVNLPPQQLVDPPTAKALRGGLLVPGQSPLSRAGLDLLSGGGETTGAGATIASAGQFLLVAGSQSSDVGAPAHLLAGGNLAASGALLQTAGGNLSTAGTSMVAAATPTP